MMLRQDQPVNPLSTIYKIRMWKKAFNVFLVISFISTFNQTSEDVFMLH